MKSAARPLNIDLSGWQVPELPPEIGGGIIYEPDIESVSSVLRQRLSDEAGDKRLSDQMAVVDWLYRLVWSNVKRGRVFELGEVLSTRCADCLGYARLFSALGTKFGIELGVVEVLIDNAGRYVPHHANILRLVDGSYRFIDAWYGSTHINHRRIGALVNGKPRDINREEISQIHDLKGLPEYCLDAITLYIKGNRRLEKGEFDSAIKFYSRAIELYPNNSRAFYNRALAYEGKGDQERAELDYAQALKDESGIIRVRATTCNLEELIKLDEKGFGEREQDIYLWHKGFKTGEIVGYEAIAREYGVSLEEIKHIILRIEAHVQTD